MIIERPLYTQRLAPFIDTDVVKVLTGMRRSGKSILLELVQQDIQNHGVKPAQIVNINFENMRHQPLRTAEALRAELLRRIPADGPKAYVFLDEIQEVENWERAISSLRVERNCDIYLTGSNAHLLSGDLATLLSGRYVSFTVYPLSFSEFLEIYESVKPGVSPAAAFMRYLVLGGMPYLHQVAFDEEAALQYLGDLFSTIELRDVVRNIGARDVDLLDRLYLYLAANIGTSFSVRSIEKFLKNEKRKVSVPTLSSYLKAAASAYLFHPVRRQDLISKELLTIGEKYYLGDHGIRQAIIGGNMRDIQLVLENIVFLELRRRGYSVAVGANAGKEIDFVAEKRGERIYIQVSYLLASEDTINREFGAFEGLKDSFPRYVVSMDELDMSRNGVQHRNIRDFLLAEAW